MTNNDETPSLHDCVRRGDEAAIRRCLARPDCDVNARDDRGETSLACADFSKTTRVVIELLLDAGANVNTRDRYSRSPLHLAVAEENRECIERLIRAGAKVDARDAFAKTPLDLAVKYGCLEIVKLLVESGAGVSYLKNDNHRPLVIYDRRNEELCDYLRIHNVPTKFSQKRSDSSLAKLKTLSNLGFAQLLDRSSVNELDSCGFSPLHLAAYRGSLRHVRVLLEERGADVGLHAGNSFEQTPLHLACLGTPADNCEIVQLLLERGADTAAVDSHGLTPLHLLIHGGKAQNRRDLIDLLVKNGADLAAKTNDGNTALHLAVYAASNREIVQRLLELGASMHSPGAEDETPWKFALRHGDLALLRLFVERDAEVPRMRMSNGETALHFAAGNANLDVMGYLIDRHGLDPKLADESGLTALHFAVRCSNVFGVNYLISRGARVEQSGCPSPLQIAVETQNLEILQILLEHGGDVKYRGIDGSVLKLGLTVGNREIRQALIQRAAVLAYQEEKVAKDGEMLIMRKQLYSDYHEECLYELRQLDLIKFHGDVSYFDLVARKKPLADYARDQELVTAFYVAADDEHFARFPMYYPALARNFTIEATRQRQLRSATVFVLRCIERALPEIVNEKIVDYVGDGELTRIGQMLQPVPMWMGGGTCFGDF